jgi:putative SOS response-associated peptidase YedK
MCGRFTLTYPNDALARLFRAAPANDLPDPPRHNICPTQTVATVISAQGTRRIGPMRWGFLPRWYRTPTDGPLLINARADTLAAKPAFREAARARRCLIPASGFYEWTKDEAGNRLPWYISARAGAGPLAFGGVWQIWDGPEGARIATCAIVTCEASAGIAHIHHRMPLILAPGDWPLWLGEAGHGAARLMVPALQTMLAAWRVDPKVNSNRAEGAGLIAPLGG